MMTRGRSLFQTSAFGGALVYLAVFLAVTGTTLGFLYNEMARALGRSGDALVWQEAAVVSRLHAAQGVDTLKDFVTARGNAGGERLRSRAPTRRTSRANDRRGGWRVHRGR